MNLKKHIHEFIQAFQPLAFSKEFGFWGYKEEELQSFIENPGQFELSLNREKGKGILYGLDHVKVRQQFLNALPQSNRMKIVKPKLDYYQLIQIIKNFFKKTKLSIESNQELTNIVDIGMGHSIYKVSLGSNTCVIKRSSVNHQLFYTNLLKALDWPSYHCSHEVINETKIWEIIEYLGENTVSSILNNPDHVENIEKELPAYAALGDVLGLGDRHLDNDMVHQNKVYPIDISFLFWEGNEQWTSHYIAGGLYEINSLARYGDNPFLLEKKMDQFFERYQKTRNELLGKKQKIKEVIQSHFDDNEKDCQRKIDFFEQRLNQTEVYFKAQKKLYSDAFSESLKRIPYKKRLEERAQQTPEILNQHPLLKMYYYANKNRSATFYLAENLKEDIFSLIK